MSFCNYRKEALRRLSRKEDINGPPRIGNVYLNSGKAERLLGSNSNLGSIKSNYE